VSSEWNFLGGWRWEGPVLRFSITHKLWLLNAKYLNRFFVIKVHARAVTQNIISDGGGFVFNELHLTVCLFLLTSIHENILLSRVTMEIYEELEVNGDEKLSREKFSQFIILQNRSSFSRVHPCTSFLKISTFSKLSCQKPLIRKKFISRIFF